MNLSRVLPILLLTCIPHLIYVLMHWQYFPLSEGMPIGQTDPDTWLRLTLIRDWLTSGDWYNHAVAGTNAPFGGITSPWTRPLDCIIAALASLQPESVELSKRLLRASLLMPWIWMTLLTLGIYRIIALNTTPRASFLMASLLIACTPTIWNYFSLGNADHHAPLAAIFIWVMGIVLQNTPSRRNVIAAGVMLGLSLWISVEALILIAAIYAWYGMEWLRGRPTPLMLLTFSTAIMAAIALAIERPQAQWLFPIYDSISIVHVAALIAAAAVAYGLQITDKRTLQARLTYAAGYAITALIGLYIIYPLLFAGPMAEVHPFIFSHFLPNISEAQAFYSAPAKQTLANLFLPLLVLTLCTMTWASPRYRFYEKPLAEKYIFFLGITLLLYVSQARWSYYLLPLSVTAMAPMFGALFSPDDVGIKHTWLARLMSGLPEAEQAKRRLPIMLLIAGTPLAILVIGNKLSPDSILSKQRTACYTFTRQLLYSGKLDTLIGMKPQTILAPTDLGAEILFWSARHRIVASNYHREGEGIKYVWESNTISDPNALRKHLAERNIKRILVCPTVQQMEGSILQGYMMHGERLPNWLKKIAYDGPTPSIEKEIVAPPILLKVD